MRNGRELLMAVCAAAIVAAVALSFWNGGLMYLAVPAFIVLMLARKPPPRRQPPKLPWGVPQPTRPQPVPQAFPPPVAVPPSLPTPAPSGVEPGEVPDELHARVAEHRRAGRTVEAIDLLREELGWELYPASQYVLKIDSASE